MKKQSLVRKILSAFTIIVTLATFNNQAFAQGVNLYLGLGLTNMAHTEGEEPGSKDYWPKKPSITAGISNEIPLAPYVYLEPGLFFSDKGYNQERGSEHNRATLYSISLPIMAKGKYDFNENFKAYVQFGPFIGSGIGGSITGYGAQSKKSIEWGNAGSGSNDFKPFDYGLTYGFGFQFKRLIFGVMKERGYANIYPNTKKYSVYNTRVLRVYLGFNLGKKMVEEKPSDS